MKSLTILFAAPLNPNGYTDACVRVAQVMQSSGHCVVFAINERSRGQLNNYGFKEQLIYERQSNSNYSAQYLFDKMPLSSLGEKINEFSEQLISSKKLNPIMKEIVEHVNPDVIVIDTTVIIPSLINCGIPWVRIWSGNPLALYDNSAGLQPPGYGIASNSDKIEWQKIRNKESDAFSESVKQYNDWLVSENCQPLPVNANYYKSPYLNIYGYPKPIEYCTDEATLLGNFYRIDCFINSSELDEHRFEIPLKLKPKSGKLVYLSLGSVVDVNLMKRLVAILSKSQHRFIIEKGLNSNRCELAHNMWGRKTLPQSSVLPLVDLVITNGNTHTVTETLYFGKPMIVMPLLFGEQYDNAQRVLETGFGIRVHPYKCTDTQLLESIEIALNNSKFEIKLKKLSQTMQHSNHVNINKIVELIEGIVEKNK